MKRRRATWRHKVLAVAFGLAFSVGVPELVVRLSGWTPPPRYLEVVEVEGVLLKLQYAVFGGADPGQIESLVSEFESAIQFGSDNPKTHFGHGLALLITGRTADGVAVLAPVLEENPDLAEALGVLVERSDAVRAAVVGNVPGF